MKHKLLVLFFCVSASSTFVPAADLAGGAAKPNVIFLMDDQHRWDALGYVDSAVKTPNLDALARSGIFYDQAVCQAPMCTPSRNAMMFGLYPNQTGVLRNGRGMPDEQLPSRPLAELFRDAGYQTAGFGKTHWGLACSTRGFETRYIAQCPEKNAVMMIDDAPEAKKRYDAESRTMGGGEENNLGYLGFTSPLPEREHRDGWVTGKCLEFIDSKIDPARPLFLYLSFLKPHAGHNVPAGYEKQYDANGVKYARQPPWKEDRSPHAAGINRRDLYVDYWSKATDEQWRLMTMRYRANCTWIDDMFGRVLKELKRKGVLDNAIIVYCSDHGEMLGDRGMTGKSQPYHPAACVPLVVAGPRVKGGLLCDKPVETLDVTATLLDYAGLTPPVDMDSISMRPFLEQGKDLPREVAKSSLGGWGLVFDGRYKLIAGNWNRGDGSKKGGAAGAPVLYDLQKDPAEANDIAKDNPVIVKRLSALMPALSPFKKDRAKAKKKA